ADPAVRRRPPLPPRIVWRIVAAAAALGAHHPEHRSYRLHRDGPRPSSPVGAHRGPPRRRFDRSALGDRDRAGGNRVPDGGFAPGRARLRPSLATALAFAPPPPISRPALPRQL